MSTASDALDFRKLFEESPGLYLVLNPKLIIVAVSDAYLRATMTKRQEILGRGVFEVFPDNPAEPGATGVRNLRASLERVLHDKVTDTMAVQKYDIRRPLSEGGASEERYWSPINSPVLDGDRGVQYIIHRVEDVTEFVRVKRQEMQKEKAAEELQAEAKATEPDVFLRAQEVQEANQRREIVNQELMRSEERFRSLVTVVKDYAIFMLDREGRVATWNEGAARIKGYSEREIVGEHFSKFYPEGDKAEGKPEKLFRQANADGRSEDEGWRIRKDGSRFWAKVVVTAIRDANGVIQGFTKVTFDLTDRKHTEDALRRSEAHLRTLFEYSPDAIMVSDAEGRITDVNGQVERFFGYPRAELIGQSVEMLVPERFRNAHLKHRENYAERAQARPMGIGLELYARKKDGSEFPVDIMLGPIKSSEGRLVLTVIRDLSERKAAEEALRRSEEEKRYLEEELTTTHGFEEIIGESAGLKRVLKQVEQVAPTDATVLILGETGTGKELIARAIHRLSPRHDRAFVKLNCSAIPAGLLESELFGHEKGAFTGAITQKIGRLELAHEGTFFLDEIGDLPLELQPKILRALQEKEFERLGSLRTIPVNVRLVAATNRNLAKMVEDGQFRSDLYYRLKVFPVQIPSLREREEDIPVLVGYFVNMHARQMNRHIETIPPQVMDALRRWRWPGNIRELENFLERAVILSQGPELQAPLGELQAIAPAVATSPANLHEAEREHILKVLRECKGMIGGTNGAAERLGLKRTTLNSKIKKLGIERRDYI
jgi:PAS domain S-box-containing protein